VSDAELRRRLAAFVQPEREKEAGGRAWQVVRTVFAAREPVERQRPVPWRPALAIGLAAAALGVGVSPAGPALGSWLRDTIGRERVVGTRPAAPRLGALPEGGRLLVTSPRGIWAVSRDGSRRFLGAYEGASWSPRGLFVAAWRERQLVALEPDTTEGLRWSLSRGQVDDARWAPSGFRIAYRSGKALRVVAGDGTGDRHIAPNVAAVAPAWKSGERHVLAYVDGSGRVTVVDADTRRVAWRSPRLAELIGLEWTGDGRVLAISRRAVRLLSEPGTVEVVVRVRPGRAVTDAALRPGAGEIVYAVRSEETGNGSVVVRGLDDPSTRLLVAGLGSFSDLTWSPNGETLLVAWAEADQWLFLPPDAEQRVRGVSAISQQFDPGRPGEEGFPGVEGWTVDERPAPYDVEH
jgi:hypothetical protein